MKLVDRSDIAAALNVSERTIRQWVTDRKIPFYRIGSATRFDEAEVAAWLEARHVRPRARA
jgi:excisionase family DNA binding protein